MTEMKSVYSAVRTVALNKAVCASSFRTNSDLCHFQHKLIGFYNRDEKCLQRGTVWGFKQSSLRFVFRGLNLSKSGHMGITVLRKKSVCYIAYSSCRVP